MTWISVKERMPRDGQMVWIYTTDPRLHRNLRKEMNGFAVAEFSVEGCGAVFTYGTMKGTRSGIDPGGPQGGITHWQPLPEPPGKDQIWKTCGCYATQSCECESPPLTQTDQAFLASVDAAVRMMPRREQIYRQGEPLEETKPPKRCDTCVFYRTNPIGQCHYDPPKREPFIGNHSIEVWPRVAADGICHHWRPIHAPWEC